MVSLSDAQLSTPAPGSGSQRQIWPPSSEDLESFADYCTPADAATSLGQSMQEFSALVKRFGIGRYHLARQHDQIVYLRRDLDRARDFLNHEKASQQ